MSGISRPRMVRFIFRFLARSFIGLCVDMTTYLLVPIFALFARYGLLVYERLVDV